MANWCDTTYAIIGKKEDLDKIEKAISITRKATKEDKIEKGLDPEADDMWEGNIIKLLGGDPHEHKEWYLRGFISCQERRSEDTLMIQADEADGDTDFRTALKSLLDVKVYFMTEEYSIDVFATNDKEGKYFPDRYIFIGSDGDLDYLDKDDNPDKYLEDDPEGRILEVEFIDD